MSHETFHPEELSTDVRPRRLKRLVDHLVSLAPFAEEPSVIDHAAVIIEEIKEQSTPTHQLNQYGELTSLSQSNPDQPELHDLLEDTAEYLVEEIEKFSLDESKHIDNLSNAWVVINAWDVARSPFTEKLCIKVLDSFRGAGRYQLVRAFNVARASNIPFDEALLAVNYEAALEVA